MTHTKDEALKVYLEDCDKHAIVPDVGGAFNAAWNTAIKQALAAPTVQKPVLAGRWHHGNGALCSGSLRIARADFDTNPPIEMQDRVFDDICEAMNARLMAQPAPVQEPFAWCVDSENSADWAIAKTKEGVEINAKLMDADCIKTAPFPLYTTPPAAQRQRVVFPAMLRKMWSGGEVQAWLDENVNKENI